MNYDDFNADQFVDFEASLSSELDDDFSTLYSNLENLVCSTEKKPSRTFVVTSEYVPSSVESSFELGEEYYTDLGNDPVNTYARETSFRPENFARSIEKKASRMDKEENLIDFGNNPANTNADKTALDYLEKALSEFVQFQTDRQISSASLSKEVKKTCSTDTRNDSPMNSARDLTYRISSVVTPTSHYGSPLSETPNVLSSSGEYESCLNQTGQESLIGAMESLRLKSARKMKRNRGDLEDFYGNSDIAIIVTPNGISETSNFRDENCEDEENADQTETSLQSKSDEKNVSPPANISKTQISGRTCMIGEKIAKSVPSYEISEALNFRDKNCEDEKNADQTETFLRSKSDMENSSSLANISENQITGRTCMIGEEIAKSVSLREISEALNFRDNNCEDEENADQTETSLRSKYDIENLLFLANIAENQTTGRTYVIGKEDNSEAATTIQPHGIPEKMNFRTEADMKNASSSATIAENRTTEGTSIIGKEDKSGIVETIPPYRILDESSSIEDIEDALPKPENPDAISEQKKKRKNPRVLTSQVRRQSLKYRRSSGQFVSMAEAMLKFQKGTPKRFRSTVKKNQNRPAEPKIESLRRVTRPVSPALRCKSRARASKLPNQEERELLEIEESRRNRFKATKSPIAQKSIPASEKSAQSSNRFLTGESKILPRRATPRKKILIKSVVSTEEGPTFEEVEISNFGVPIPRTKSPLTKPVPFSFEKREKKILERREELGSTMREAEKRRTINPRSSAASSTAKSESLEGASRRPIDLTFRERNELLLAKKKLIADRAREEKQARLFHARLAPPVKQVLVRGTSTDNLGPEKVARLLKQAPARGTSTENLGPANFGPSTEQEPERGTSTENLGPTDLALTLKTHPGRGTSTENLGPANIALMAKRVPGRGTSTENLSPANFAPSVKQVAGRGTSKNLAPANVVPTLKPGRAISTENSGLAANKPKARGLSPAGRSRGLSPAERSRGLSPAGRSRGLSPAGRSRGLSPAGRSRGLSPAERSRGLSPAERSRGSSPSIADRENRDPNVSSMSNQCPKLKAPLSLYTEDRSKKRQEFDATRRSKEEEAEEQRREYEAYRLAQEKKEERELRKTMESRARPMPVFKQPKVAKSLKPLTDPQSPAWSWKKNKK